MIEQFKGGYRFLSNFAQCTVEFEGMLFPTVEHAYQAAKTLDHQDRLLIKLQATPGYAKRKGRKVIIRDDWDDIKLQVMEYLNRQKYNKPYFRKKLLETESKYIQEGNYWHDTFWGVDLKTGKGENHLGKIIMRIREEIQNEVRADKESGI